ncbi:dymeclin isoform X1, partial [Tachysurus ichikawai]
LFALLSKKHNKVLERATQSLQRTLGADGTALPDYVSKREGHVRAGGFKEDCCVTSATRNGDQSIMLSPWRRHLGDR